MKLSSMTERLASLGSEKWRVHFEGRQRAAHGDKLIFLSIGEPDLPPAAAILDFANRQMRSGRTRYSPGEGEQSILDALSRHYTKLMNRPIAANQFIYLPGTQTALYVAFASTIEKGDEVLLFDPYYATYEAVVTAPGGVPVPVALDPDRGFHPNIAAIENAITPKTKALLLNSPSNPTGAVFTAAEIDAICAIAKKHDLWIISDEVYATLIHSNQTFVSPFMRKDMEDRTIVVSSISKSHGLPGFRSGWIAASEDVCRRALPVAETFLFGQQPFLQDAAAYALDNHFPEVVAMRNAYFARASAMVETMAKSNRVKARMPEGGMFVMVDVRATGLSGDDFASRLLAEENVVTMPGESFGTCGAGHLRVALTVPESEIREAAARIVRLSERI
jgi:arginine:pyruvate transaminase